VGEGGGGEGGEGVVEGIEGGGAETEEIEGEGFEEVRGGVAGVEGYGALGLGLGFFGEGLGFGGAGSGEELGPLDEVALGLDVGPVAETEVRPELLGDVVHEEVEEEHDHDHSHLQNDVVRGPVLFRFIH